MGASLLPSSSSRFSLLRDTIPQNSRFRISAALRFNSSSTSFILPASRQRRLPLSTVQVARLSHREDGGKGLLPAISTAVSDQGRIGEVKRVTKETSVHVKLNLDGSGIADCSTGIPFLDHMLDQLASHGVLDIFVRASGDTHIDDHHTNEDIALAIGTALLQALGDRKGINRFGHFAAPLDEAAVEVILDLSGRPHLSCDLQIPTERVGTYDTQLLQAIRNYTLQAFASPLNEEASSLLDSQQFQQSRAQQVELLQHLQHSNPPSLLRWLSLGADILSFPNS